MALLPSLDVEHLSCPTHYLDKLYQVLYNDLYIVHDQEIYSGKTTHGNKPTLASSFIKSVFLIVNNLQLITQNLV